MKAKLSHSRLRCARSCQRLHHFQYELGYRPVEDAEVLRFGTLSHDGQEAWWRSPPETRLQAALEAMRRSAADPYELAKAEAMMIGYHERWADQPYEVLAVEVPFTTALRNPDTGRTSIIWELTGKLDAVVRDVRDGRVFGMEHKTSSEDISAGSNYWKRVRMDGQVSVYFEGAKALGHDIAGFIYDVLKKPALKPYKATPPESRKYKADGTLYANQRADDETPEAFRARVVEAVSSDLAGYFARGEVVRLEDELTEAQRDIWQLAHQLREAERIHSFPRNPDACVMFGRTCPFFGVCAGEASLEDESLFTRREQRAASQQYAPREGAAQ